MPNQNLTVAVGPSERTVVTAEGKILTAPADWILLPPGDAALTRRVKLAGPTWSVQEKRGRKIFSRGMWCPAATVEQIRADLAAERADPAHAKKKAADAARREKKHGEYVEDFRGAVLQFLGFSSYYSALAEKLATAVTAHATPVGSGTVARTERIPIEQRAEAAVIAWLRHQTTAYDEMKIARIKGERREVRRELAEQSRKLLNQYRSDFPVNPDTCPLRTALNKAAAEVIK
ncbi:hypothetical protein ETAA8_04690 [Anatilimnocola aggregata]|uniref:DUF2293 domain-containing protein n=1 Tax=Anatilimnocola aggregata TaxID=2528021 RepID=A0A517Y583_9BACT|nr:DUF2293 domain-containing protein [Anatilimnocola aggregata]QDU25401.1 hypothetical protein ETAA8_04690 [Anatilimnocola aggregata]